MTQPIDTSPAALQSWAFKIEQVEPEMVAELLLAIAAEKKAQAKQEPVAWTLKSELEAQETTCRAHLWFSNPLSSAWAPLYLAPQHHPEQHLEMVAAADLDKARQVYMQSDNRLNLAEVSAAFESAGVPDESGKRRALVAPAKVPLSPDERQVLRDAVRDSVEVVHHGVAQADVPLPEPFAWASYGRAANGIEGWRFATCKSTFWDDKDQTPLLTPKQAEAYAKAAVAAERARLCSAIKAADDLAVSDADYMLDSDDCIKVIQGTWVFEPTKANQKGTV